MMPALGMKVKEGLLTSQWKPMPRLQAEGAFHVTLLSGVSSLRRSHPGGHFLDLDSEVNHRDINGKIAQSHDSELARIRPEQKAVRTDLALLKMARLTSACSRR